MNDGKLSRPTLIVLVASMAVSFYFMITYSGPFQWFAEAQLRWWSWYSEKLTFLLTYLLIVGVGMLLAWPYQRGAARAGEQADEPGDAAGVKRPGLWARLGEAGQMGVYVVAVGLIVAGLGLRDMRRLSGNADLTDLSIERLEAGEAPPSRWVNLSAIPLVEAAVTFKSSSDKDEDAYVPLLSHDHDPAAGVRAFAKYDGNGNAGPPDRMQPTVIQGLIAPGGLPGPVRAEYERAGMLRAGQAYYLIEPGKDPVTQRDRAMGTVKVGSAIIGGGAVAMLAGFLWTRRRLRRTTPAPALNDQSPV